VGRKVTHTKKGLSQIELFDFSSVKEQQKNQDQSTDLTLVFCYGCA
jgi:hypothetical protein